MSGFYQAAYAVRFPAPGAGGTASHGAAGEHARPRNQLPARHDLAAGTVRADAADAGLPSGSSGLARERMTGVT